MAPRRRRGSRARDRLPHTRGGGPVCGFGTLDPAAAFPAHAGMDPPTSRRRSSPRWLPRTRGDGPTNGTGDEIGQYAPSHTRGWTLAETQAEHRHVGSPHTRGLTYISPIEFRAHSASPHTRGWTPSDPERSPAKQRSPAYAGMDPSSTFVARGFSRLPARAGMGAPQKDEVISYVLAAPHTRGRTARARQCRRFERRLPAHVGVDPPFQQ